MPSLGFPELVVILIVALLIFGPKKLPEIGRAFGRTIKEFKKGAKEIMEEDSDEKKSSEVKKDSEVQQ